MALNRIWLYRALIFSVLLGSVSLAISTPDEYQKWSAKSDIKDYSFTGNQTTVDNGSISGNTSEGVQTGDNQSQEDASADSSTEADQEGDSDTGSNENPSESEGEATLFESEEESNDIGLSGATLAMPTRLVALLVMAALCACVISGLTAGIAVSEGVRTGLILALLGPLLAVMHGKESDIKTRGRILGYVEAHPGIHFSALRDALGLANGVTAHHLYVLEREGEAISWSHGRKRRFAVSSIDPKRIEEIRSPVTGMQLAIMEILSESGHLGMTATELRTKLEASRQLMNYHLKQLKVSEMVSSSGSGRKARWILTDTAHLRMATQ